MVDRHVLNGVSDVDF